MKVDKIYQNYDQSKNRQSRSYSSAVSFSKKPPKKLNDKITRANAAVESYKARLEKKFQSMDLLISQIQDQYSSFLSF